MRHIYMTIATLTAALGVYASSDTIPEPERNRLLKMQSVPQKIRISNYPTLGERKALVLLVEFEDVKFSSVPDAGIYFNALLNEPGFTHDNGADGSARDFYIASSDGRFLPNFVTVGPIGLPKTSAYYGGNTGGKLDEHAHEMLLDACLKIDDHTDFSEFDEDDDGEVDNIYIFYAGYGEADTGEDTHIWPQSNLLFDNKGIDLVLDGVRVNHYACSNEIRLDGNGIPRLVGIGTFVHEFGHVLGISDHYDSTFAGRRPGVDNWDTMAAANYFNNTNTPPLFSSFERAELGWLEYEELTPHMSGQSFVLAPLSQENRAFRVTVPDTDENEYFVLECRAQQGWDRFLPGHGLLVWHIDMDRTAWLNNKVNTDPTHNRVDIIEADGYESINNLAGDPFPGKRKVTSFTFKSWSGKDVFSISDINEDVDGNVAFTFNSSVASVPDFIQNRPEIVSAFDLNGHEVCESFNGIAIIRYSDGRVRKMVFK